MIDPELNLRDQILQRTAPTIMVPRFEPLKPLTEYGHRYLIAEEGLYIEVNRPWMRCIEPIAATAPLRLPYGRVYLVRDVANNIVAHMRRHVTAFVDLARQHLPNECAAWIVWSIGTEPRLLPLDAAEASPGHVQYIRPNLEPGQWCVADLHSHAHGRAFFSETDDMDDAGDVKFAIVVGFPDGNLDVKLRLCLLGLFDDEFDDEPWFTPA